ncbi:hypothetical protein K0B96_11575 [Horticoccus luteus]|uniref:Phosphoribosyltransferase domain-containing protein n=1 Tax=Horticoccus luteus TaxID=2862869 RepID=A0A8F9XK88_9BACT|nr:phosphoribosyltransferase family protein [Horticoccus luteus]QYM77951.1 hypothetical protein K0B96_11575 [Horticoccus luteus]
MHHRTFHGTTEFGSVTTLLPYRDRRAAGQVLAEQLHRFTGRMDLVVIALARGGVPVGYEISRALRAPLDVFVVHRLAFPGEPDLVMGALASGGVCVLDRDVMQHHAIDAEAMKRAVAEALPFLERREQALRGDRPPLDVRDRHVLFVDDGVATGATMRVALAGLRAQSPASVTIAVPVGASGALEALAVDVDEIVCPRMPDPLFAVGLSYDRFPDLDDADVCALLARAPWSQPAPHVRRAVG